jgi:dTDP-4-dehydrorhamnose 3,5-epimerase
MIRCIKGGILDVFVDLRLNSQTFGQWDSMELTEDNKTIALIPRGFAHGFCTLTEVSEVVYKVDNYYSKEHECGIVWNDKTINIQWPEISPILSEKDKNNLTFDQFIKLYKGI